MSRIAAVFARTMCSRQQHLLVSHGFCPRPPPRPNPPSHLCLASMPRKAFRWQVPPDKNAPKCLSVPLTRTTAGIEISPSGRSNLYDWNVSKDSSESRLMLVDGKALVYRAYYRISSKIFHGALKKMSAQDLPENSSWDSTMTTVVTLTELLNLLELKPSHIAVVFDFSGKTFRHILFPEYKGRRAVSPDTVRQAVRDTKHAILAMGVKVLEVPGVEADDVIGTLSSQALKAGMKVRVASQDKDFFQLLCSNLRLLRFQAKGSKLSSYGLEEFRESFPNLEVSQIVDVRALVGDVADNIPGVKGIGDVTARKLIREFGTLERLLENRDQIKNSRARNSLLLDKGEAIQSKKLLTLRLDLPAFAIGCSLQNLRCKEPEDGGESYSKLVSAFGAIVGQPAGMSLMQRTTEYWGKVVRESGNNPGLKNQI